MMRIDTSVNDLVDLIIGRSYNAHIIEYYARKFGYHYSVFNRSFLYDDSVIEKDFLDFYEWEDLVDRVYFELSNSSCDDTHFLLLKYWVSVSVVPNSVFQKA